MRNRWSDTLPKAGATSISAAVSTALHALAIGAAVVATTAPLIPEVREIPEVFAKFLAPPPRQPNQDAQRETLKYLSLVEPDLPVKGQKIVPVDEIRPAPERQVSGLELTTSEARDALVGQDSVFTEVEVDSAATRYSWSAAPAYPAAMLTAKREGYVKAQWVVDEAGYADTTTLKLLDWTSDEFAKAVRDALPFMRFSPAKVGSKTVKQLVQQEFTFRITTVMAGAGAAKKP